VFVAGQGKVRQEEDEAQESSNEEGKSKKRDTSICKRRRDTTTESGQLTKKKTTNNRCKACGLENHQWRRCWYLFPAMRRGDQISPEIKEKIEQSLKDPVFIKQVEEERKQKRKFQEDQS
jgi:hypothetical protein